MEFCSPFDATLAGTGPPAVFLPDRHGAFRLAPNWTREAWERAPAVEPGRQFALCRDRDSGFVVLALVTGKGLMEGHPRLDVRAFDALEDAVACRARCGDPPIRKQPW